MLLNYNVVYTLLLRALDGPGAAVDCEISFMFTDESSVKWWLPREEESLVPEIGGDPSPSRFYNIRGQCTFIEYPGSPQYPCAQSDGGNPTLSNIYVAGSNPLKFTLQWFAIETSQGGAYNIGLASVQIKFSETGDFVNPDFMLTATGSGVTTNSGVIYTDVENVPINWGQSSNGAANVQVLVSDAGYIPVGTEVPVIQYKLIAEEQ